MKKIFRGLLLTVLLAGPLSAEDVTWGPGSESLSKYNLFFVQSLDLRELKKELLNPNYDEFNQEFKSDYYIQDDALQELAVSFYRQLSAKLNEFIPVKEEEYAGQPAALVAELTLSGAVPYEEKGFLTQMLFKQENAEAPVPLHLRCVIKDGETGAAVLTFADDQEYSRIVRQEPFVDDSEKFKVWGLFEQWAERLKGLLFEKSLESK